MAQARMPEAFFKLAAHHLPPEQPVGREGGRPCLDHRVVLKVLWFVLTTGCRWEDVPPELGCSGMTAHRCLRRWEEMGVWDRLHVDLLRLLRRADKLDPDLVIIDAVIVRAFGGGELTGPSPVDRRKRGSKHTLLVDRHGVPLAIRTAPANASDHRQIIRLVLDFPRVTGIGCSLAVGPGGEVLAQGPYGEQAEALVCVEVRLRPSVARGTGFAEALWGRGYRGP